MRLISKHYKIQNGGNKGKKPSKKLSCAEVVTCKVRETNSNDKSKTWAYWDMH